MKPITSPHLDENVENCNRVRERERMNRAVGVRTVVGMSENSCKSKGG